MCQTDPGTDLRVTWQCPRGARIGRFARGGGTFSPSRLRARGLRRASGCSARLPSFASGRSVRRARVAAPPPRGEAGADETDGATGRIDEAGGDGSPATSAREASPNDTGVVETGTEDGAESDARSTESPGEASASDAVTSDTVSIDGGGDGGPGACASASDCTDLNTLVCCVENSCVSTAQLVNQLMAKLKRVAEAARTCSRCRCALR